MELVNGFRKLFLSENKRWVLLVGAVAIIHLLFLSFSLPHRNAIRSLLPGNEDSMENNRYGVLRLQSSVNSAIVRNPLTINSSDMSTRNGVFNLVLNNGNSSISNVGGDVRNGSEVMGDHRKMENGFASKITESDGRNSVGADRNTDDDYASENAEDLNEFAVLDDIIRDQDNYPLEQVVEPVQVVSAEKLLEDDSIQTTKEIGHVNTTEKTPSLASPAASSLTMKSTNESGHGFTLEQFVKHGQEISTGKLLENKTSQTVKELGHVNTPSQSTTFAATVVSSMANKTYLRNPISNSTSLQRDGVASTSNSVMIGKPRKKKMKCEMPPKSVTTFDEMNRILVRHRRSSRAMVIYIMMNG